MAAELVSFAEKKRLCSLLLFGSELRSPLTRRLDRADVLPETETVSTLTEGTERTRQGEVGDDFLPGWVGEFSEIKRSCRGLGGAEAKARIMGARNPTARCFQVSGCESSV